MNEREELIDHVLLLIKMQVDYPKLPEEYKEQLQNEIDFCNGKIKEIERIRK